MLPEIDAIKATVKGHIKNGDTWMNVFHFRKSGDDFTDDIAILGPGIVAAYEDNLLPVWGDGTRLESVDFADMSESPPVVLNYEVGPDLVGTSEEDNLPGQIAAVCSWRTLTGGRAGRGRTYIAGLAEDMNTLESGPHTTLLTAINSWAVDMIAIVDGLCIVSYFEGHTYGGSTGHKTIPTPRATPILSDVVSGSCNGRWGSMRSRNNGK